jgi:hypothetical protein
MGARLADLDAMLRDQFRRRAPVEEALQQIAKGKRGPLTAEEAQRFASLIGVPDEHRGDTSGLLRAEIVDLGARVMDTQVTQAERIRVLEEALRPFAEINDAVETSLPGVDERWALVRVRDKGITYGDLVRAKAAMEGR